MLASLLDIVIDHTSIGTDVIHVLLQITREAYRLKKLEKQYQGFISPDCSIYRDMPRAIQITNIYRNRAMERLRRAGFEIRLAEETCEHFAIIDREIVWYGTCIPVIPH